MCRSICDGQQLIFDICDAIFNASNKIWPSNCDKCKQFSINMVPNKPENVNEKLAKYFYGWLSKKRVEVFEGVE